MSEKQWHWMVSFFFLYQSPPIRDLSFDQLEISLLSKFSMMTEFKGGFTTGIRAILKKS